jgi:hypothetical protein
MFSERSFPSRSVIGYTPLDLVLIDSLAHVTLFYVSVDTVVNKNE